MTTIIIDDVETPRSRPVRRKLSPKMRMWIAVRDACERARSRKAR